MQYLWHHVLKKSDVPLNHYMNLRVREAHNCKRKARDHKKADAFTPALQNKNPVNFIMVGAPFRIRLEHST